MSYWKGKVIVVTGGSAGLGLCLASTAIERGANVALIARNSERLSAACQRLGHRAVAFSADITSQQEVDRCHVDILNRFGRVDALLKCAGKSTRGQILNTTPEEFQQLYELNFLALVRCTRAFMPELIDAKGHLVNIGSLASKSVSRFLGAYPASKFPVAAYSHQLRLELEETGVHILLACPGPIARTDAGERYSDTNVPAAAQQPGGGVKLKGIDPELLAEKIFLACERRQPELVVPAKARLLFVLSQISPRLGDWMIRKMSG